MSLRDRLSDGLASVISYVDGLATDSIEKAARQVVTKQQAPEAGQPKPSAEEPKALLWDPFAIIDQLGYKDRPSGLTYSTLSEMIARVPICSAIVQTRVTQVTNFATPRMNDQDAGFQVKLRDLKRSPTKQEQKRALVITDWLQHTGSTRSVKKDNFETFLQKTTRDSLHYDQLTFEIIRNRKGDPCDFLATDAATFRIADTPPGADFNDDQSISYVQIYDETVIAEFMARDLCFGVRNPRTGIRLNGYGYAEMEMMIQVVTSLLWGFSYNSNFFRQGTVSKGILNFKGSIPDSKLDDFRRRWYSMVSGVANAWRTPITNAEELQYINMHTSNRDMEYAEWMNFLIKLACAIWQTDPSELNFIFGNTGQASQMFQSPVENRVVDSRDRGLRPLLGKLATWLNTYCIWQVPGWEDFEIQFAGINPQSSKEVVDQKKAKATFLQTVDELRAEDDLPPLPDGKGEVILDPTWLQFSQAKDQAEQMEQQQQQMQEQQGQPGMDGQQQPGAGWQPGQEQQADQGQEEQGSPYDQLVDRYHEGETEKSMTIRGRRNGEPITWEFEL